MKLDYIHTICGQIRLLTGLHIGGSNDQIEIGGMDQPIIKNPFGGEPYIPGSSLKGKMRSLLEQVYRSDQIVENKGGPCKCGDCKVCKIFGTSGETVSEELGPTRIIVRDARLSKDWLKRFEEGEFPLEAKYENFINRIKGTAEHPRPLERVPAQAVFDFNISFKLFDTDVKDDLIQCVWKGLRLIEMDGLGGSVSRGSGQVKFENVHLDETPVDEEIASVTLFERDL